MFRTLLCSAGGLVILAVPFAGLAQEPPKPGPEFDHLKNLVGVWEASAKLGDAETKGTLTYKMELGGLWLVGNFEGEFAGQKFQGKSLDTYDMSKKKYTNIWIDSMSTAPMVTEGTYDKETKALTMTGEAPGSDGKPSKVKTVTTYKDKDHFVLVMFMGGKDGKGEEMMTISYMRKK
ncbi:MAG: DUF1579 domain-containing protein [Gemmataceae bacterium]